ncbi:MAG: anhydro-N-acetylmuramic acid kinase [Solimonas sp.]
MRSGICVGLISGTSLDAVDAAACEFDNAGRAFRLLGAHGEPYPPALRRELLDLQRSPDTPITLRDVARLDAAIGNCFAQAALALLSTLNLRTSDVAAIGSHGQTLFHDPVVIRSSLQLGDPNRIAARTGIRTIADFRRADMAHGGQGAPLMPAFHQAIFSGADTSVVVNIGGISNITILPGDGNAAFGFDTGPGNALLDDWILRERGLAYDRDGAWASSGALCTDLLDACLRDPYFTLPAPKSTGRDYFNLDWLTRRVDALPESAAVQRTLLELTAESLSRAVERSAPEARHLFVCGGGARNAFLMERLSARLPAVHVTDTSARGLDPDWVEAAGFAWLAWRTLNGRPGNLPSVTGARRAVVLGGLYEAD